MALSKPHELLEHPKARFATAWPVTASANAFKKAEIRQWAISSQASKKLVDGSTSNAHSPNVKPRAMRRHERGECL